MEYGPATVWDLAKYGAIPTQQSHGINWRKFVIHEKDNRASIRLGLGFRLGWRGKPSRPTKTWTVAVEMLGNNRIHWSCGLHQPENELEGDRHCMCVNILLTKLALEGKCGQ